MSSNTSDMTDKAPIRTYNLDSFGNKRRNIRIQNDAGETLYLSDVHLVSHPHMVLYKGNDKNGLKMGSADFPIFSTIIKLCIGDSEDPAAVWEDLTPSKWYGGHSYGFSLPTPSGEVSFTWKRTHDVPEEHKPKSFRHVKLVDAQNNLVARFVNTPRPLRKDGPLEIYQDIGGERGDEMIILTGLAVLEKKRRKRD
jgi:hypothetical protein